jgi:hypothetical protein
MAAFREAIRLKPDLIEAYLGLAVVLRADGQSRSGGSCLLNWSSRSGRNVEQGTERRIQATRCCYLIRCSRMNWTIE